MRIWSLHPKYLDAKGIVALWRETLLAKHVLEGKTKGYKNHPQLQRFKEATDPLAAINRYLAAVYDEALSRGYNFDQSKFARNRGRSLITVTTGQMKYEAEHLVAKLHARDKKKFEEIKSVKTFEPHPLFKVVKGTIEEWERVS
jgi:hypothetical protein